MPDSESLLESHDSAASDRLDSWKEIAAYLGRDLRTVRRWEKAEGLPVHRHVHSKRATVYAFEAELDGWLNGREERKVHGDTATADRRRPLAYALAISVAAALIVPAYLFWMRPAFLGLGTSGASAKGDGALGGANHDPKYTILFGESPTGRSARQALFDISPSGDRGVFRVTRDGEPRQLYIYEQSGAVVRPLLNDLGPWQGFRYPSWSPSGHLIAYVADRLAEPGTETVDGEPDLVSAIFVVSPDGGKPRQIGTTMSNVSGVCWTPDGQSLTYLDATRDGIHTVSLDGSGIKTISADTAAFISFGGYSPDGRWLAIIVRPETELRGEYREIRILPATGGQAVSLPTGQTLFVSLTWAPDSSSIYFTPTVNELNIWKQRIDPKTGAPQGDPVQVTFFSGTMPDHPKFIDGGQRIAFVLTTGGAWINVADASSPTKSRGAATGMYPKLSPDGQVLYFRNWGPTDSGIYAVQRDGGTPLRLADGYRFDTDFELSPDGAIIAYVTSANNEPALFTVSTHGGEPRLLVDFDKPTRAVPRWSPDSSLLAYAHESDHYVLPADGGTPKKLAELPRWDAWSLQWSPDGEFIAVLGYPAGVEGEFNAVFVVPASGGELRQLTPAVDLKWTLQWHPDGQRLTYQVYLDDSFHDSETRQVFLDGRPASSLGDRPLTRNQWGRWAPDGRLFYFVSSSGGRMNLHVYDEATGDESLFANNAKLPIWSRDGKTMAWVTMKRTRQIWTMSDFR